MWVPLPEWFFKDGKITSLGNDMLQVLLSFVLVHFFPMGIYYLFDLVTGVDMSYGVYVATLLFLNTMSILILTECIVAYVHKGAPEKAGAPEAPATAIVCAYLPNEAETVFETLDHFLAFDYEPGIQVILAYNTPTPIEPAETELKAMADKHPNLLIIKILNSRSKCQNLNAALDFVVGDFIGMFDADHLPDFDSYSRAWRWLSNGYDVVQGHCLSRNPEETWMARMVAIEFETIYAVAHPGRTVRDGFGVFGGSNGYWKSPLLKRIGMLGSMLTEDIDSSMRVLAEGGRIGTDPKLISAELSTTTVLHTWNQRLRWAQGWMQVSMKHCVPLILNPKLGLRQKFGMFMLLFIREVYPWIASQIITLLMYWYFLGREFDFLDPLLLSATAFTALIGPVTAVFTYFLCHHSLRNPLWFVQYAVFSLIIYTDAKNVCARVAHLKQLAGESAWRVTPRSAKAENMAIEEAEPGDEPKETGIQAVGEPSMSVMSASALSKSGHSSFASIAESRSRFRDELSRGSRNRFHWSRNEEESSQIGESSQHHILTHIEWSKPGKVLRPKDFSRASRDASRASQGGFDWSFRGLGIDYSQSRAPSLRHHVDQSKSVANLDAEGQFWTMKEEEDKMSNKTDGTDEEPDSPPARDPTERWEENSHALMDVAIDEDTPSIVSATRSTRSSRRQMRSRQSPRPQSPIKKKKSVMPEAEPLILTDPSVEDDEAQPQPPPPSLSGAPMEITVEEGGTRPEQKSDPDDSSPKGTVEPRSRGGDPPGDPPGEIV